MPNQIKIRIVIIDPDTRDAVTYELADLAAAEKFIKEKLAEQKKAPITPGAGD